MGTRVPAMPYAPPSYYGGGDGGRIIDLILRQGDIQAQGARERARVHGEMVQQLGSLAGQALDAYFARKEDKKLQAQEAQRSRQLQGFFDNWDGNPDTLTKGLATIYGPDEKGIERGMRVADHFLSVQKSMQERDQTDKSVRFDDFKRRIGFFAESPEDFVAQNWQQARPELAKSAAEFFGMDPSQIPEEWAPNIMPTLVMLDEKLNPQKPAGNVQTKDIRDAEGRMVTHQLDPRTGKWAPAEGLPASVPEAPKGRPQAAIGSFEDFVVRKYGENPTAAQVEAARRQWAAADDKPAAPEAPRPGKPLLSGEVKTVQEFRAGLNALDTITESVEKTGAGAKAATLIPGIVTELTGWGSDSKSRQALLEATKQTIGKAMEGGVLRKEDEEKYKRMLPLIGDPPEVAAQKMRQIKQRMLDDSESYLEVLEATGRDVSQIRELLFGGQKLGGDESEAAAPPPVTVVGIRQVK